MGGGGITGNYSNTVVWAQEVQTILIIFWIIFWAWKPQ